MSLSASGLCHPASAIPLTPGELQALGTIEGPDVWTLLGIEDPEKKKKAALREKIAILDAFTGTDSTHLYYGTKAQAQHTLDTIEKTYANLADNLYDGLLFQTRLRPYLNAIRFGMDDAGKLQLDYSGVAALFDEVHAKNPGKAFTDLGELLAKGNADGSNTDLAPLAEKFVQYVQEASNNGTFEAYSNSLGKESLAALGHSLGTDNDDTLRGNHGANYLVGNKGNDSLYGYEGKDILDGGKGDDYMEGGDFGSDTYLFQAGHGKDFVAEIARGDEDADTLRFAGAKAGDVHFSREDQNLVINAYGNTDRVTLRRYFYNDDYRHFHFQFDDKTLEMADIAKHAFTFAGTDGGDSLYGWVSNDTIHGGDGDDRISGYAGDDTLHGDAGNDSLRGGDGNDRLDGGTGDDTLEGEAGNDSLAGGEGNDQLYGGEGKDTLDGGRGDDYMEGGDYGSDTYVFQAGHGKDLVAEIARGDEDADTLRFAGAKAGDVHFSREGSNLVINAYGNTDRVTLRRYFYNDDYRHFHFQFDDKTLEAVDVAKNTFTVTGTDANDSINGWITNDTIQGGAGDDYLAGDGGDDHLDGGTGNDTLRGGSGNDDLAGGEGDDSLRGDEGNDSLDGGTGADTLEGGAGNDSLAGGEGNDQLYGGEGKDTLDGGRGDDYMEGGDYGSDTYVFRAGHGKDLVAEIARGDEEADTLRFAGAKAADVRFSREGSNLVVNAYGTSDQVTLRRYFYNDDYRHFHFQFDDATFKAAELRGIDLPTEGLKAPVDAATQSADTQTKTAVPAEENAPTASTTDDKKAETNAQKPIVASDPARPAPQKVIAETAANTPQANADADVASGDSTAEADTPANVVAAAVETAQPAENGAAGSMAKNATTAAKPVTALAPVAASTKIQPATVAADTQQTPAAAASASGDSLATASQKASPATAQQNATALADALKAGGTTAAAASALDANAARQSQQMLSAMAAQGQTATPTALAAPDLQTKPQLVASQV